MNDGSGSSHSERDSDNGPASWWRRLTQRLAGGPRTREDLNELLDGAHESGLVDADAASMIRGVFETGQLQVRDIMVPRAQMVVVERDWPLEQLLASVVESGHSRYPVIGDSRDEIVGILLAKDLLRFTSSEAPDFDIARWLRPAAFVPESKRVNVLLKDFRKSRNHMALVADEYGGVAGLVTIEDVLEQIVGEIEDEHDVEEDSYIKPLPSGDFLVKALTPIDNFNEAFDTGFPDDEFDTVGGLVMSAFGHLPKRNETTEIGAYRFRILNADSRRIHLIRLTPIAR